MKQLIFTVKALVDVEHILLFLVERVQSFDTKLKVESSSCSSN